MLQLQIKGMSCGHCVRAVTQAIQAVDPDAKVQVDLVSGSATVQTSEPVQAIVESLQQEGYAATDVSG